MQQFGDFDSVTTRMVSARKGLIYYLDLKWLMEKGI